MTVTDRISTLPKECPTCGATHRKVEGDQWHHYRHIPGAPAVGCGSCGAVLYVTEAVFGVVRDQAREALPKAAAEKGRRGRRVR